MTSLEKKAELLSLRAEIIAIKAERLRSFSDMSRPSKLNVVRSVFNGHPMSREEVIQAVWSKYPGLNVSERQVSVAVKSLAAKREIYNTTNGANRWNPAMYAKLSVLLALLLLSGCSNLIPKEPFDRLEQQSVAPEFQPMQPMHFTTPGRAIDAVLPPFPLPPPLPLPPGHIKISFDPSPDPRVTEYLIWSSTDLVTWRLRHRGTGTSVVYDTTGQPQEFYGVQGLLTNNEATVWATTRRAMEDETR